MSEKKQTDIRNDSFDALLKSALSCQLDQETEAETEKSIPEHEFSEAFCDRIQSLIARADEIAGEPETKDDQDEKVLESRSEDGAEAAQARMAEKVIPFPGLRAHRKSLVNAASLLVVFGLGVLFMKQSGVLMPSGSGAAAAAVAGAPSETAAGAPETIAEAGTEAPQAAMFRAALSDEAAEERAAGPVPETAAADTGAASGSSRAMIANPVQEVENSDAIREALGISLSVPEALGTGFSYRIISGKLGEIEYTSRGLSSSVTYRAMKIGETGEAQDISGIYYPFDEARTEEFTVDTAGEETVMKLQFTDSASAKGALVTWERDGVQYSFWVADSAAGAEAIKAEVQAVFRN